MNINWILAISSILLAIPIDCPADWISDSHSPDITVRRMAIDTLQTEDDPRIPAVCLPLLQDEGYSIRRQAARAIGSRFAQISSYDRARYVEALQTCAALGPDDVTLICQRAIGLLTQNYSFPSFSVSPNQKWVLYERRRLPVIANIARQQHFLLSPYDPAWLTTRDQDGLLKTMVTNKSATALFAPHWQPSGNAVAFTIEQLEARFYHPIFVWNSSTLNLQLLNFERFQPVLGSRRKNWGTTTEFVRWKGDDVFIRIFDYGDSGNTIVDPNEEMVSYNIVTEKIALISSQPKEP